MNYILEVCAGSLTSAMNARAGGGHRVELCENLAQGGTTPSPSSILLARKRLGIPVFVLIRPRPGDFLYSDTEFAQMKEDILFCREQGADGVVLGILRADGSIDTQRTSELVTLAHPMQVTFHRAFDLSADPFQAMEAIIAMGIGRILTSGQAATSIEGAALIAELVRKAAGRITIMPGGGISEENVIDLIRKTGVREVHASLRVPVKSAMEFRNDRAIIGDPGAGEYLRYETETDRVKSFLKVLDSV